MTPTEAQTIWDNRSQSCKCYDSSVTKDTETFVTFRMTSELEGQPYAVNSSQDGVSITHSTSDALVETRVKAYFESKDKIELPASSENTI